MRRFSNSNSNSNQQPLLPLNMSHYSDAVTHVAYSKESNAPNQSSMTSMSTDYQDTLIGLTRQEVYLQKTLQNLLDAQSQGLLSGLGLSIDNNELSPFRADTSRSGSVDGNFKGTKAAIPARQTTNKKVGLRGARRGIFRAINDLGALKSREGQVMEAQLAEVEDYSTAVQGLASKQKGLEQQVQNIKSEGASQKVEQLKEQETALDVEIKKLENQLWEMKARQRHLLGQIKGLDNSVQSKLSSYKAALLMAEKEGRAFLARPKMHSSGFRGEGERDSLWKLPVERRTLEMAAEHFNEERETLKQRSMDIEVEKKALEEGLVMWDDVVSEVTALEKTLREEMQWLAVDQTSKEGEKDGAVGSMHTILKRMESTKSHIGSQLKLADERNWKLLVCCIGAEFEAVNEGYEVLRDALRASQNSDTAERDTADTQRGRGDRHFINELIPRSPNMLKPHDAPPDPSRFLDKSEDEDDEPGPELLISHMEDE